MDRARFNLKRAIIVMANHGGGRETLVSAKALEGLVQGHEGGVYFIKAYRAFGVARPGESTLTYELGATKRPIEDFFREAENLKLASSIEGPARYWSLDNRRPVAIALSDGNVDAFEMLSGVDDPDEEEAADD